MGLQIGTGGRTSEFHTPPTLTSGIQQNKHQNVLQHLLMAKKIATPAKQERFVSRPGVHAKTKTSSHKRSKNYKKKYRGQGK